jgi:polysaccharide export outer membrane protein
MALVAGALLAGVSLEAQSRQPAAAPGQTQAARPPLPAGVPLPDDYVIGAEDVLGVFVWQEPSLTVDAVVRPDGMISVPLVNDVRAAGLTPDELRVVIEREATKHIRQPTVTVVVKQINSRKVYITGAVGKQGAFPLLGPMTVLQLIAAAGGLTDFADQENIRIIRTDENGRQISLRFNFKEVKRGGMVALRQNILLKPGDTVIVDE